jgi:hypothetical protein
MEAMVFSVATAVLTKFGEKAIEAFWQHVSAGRVPVARQDSAVYSLAATQGKTLIPRQYTVGTSTRRTAVVIGEFYISEMVHQIAAATGIAVVLVTGTKDADTYLLVADIHDGYQITLPAGRYSFCVFFMNTEAETFFDAEVYAVGFPSGIDHSALGEISFHYPVDILNVMNDQPKQLLEGEEYVVDFLLVQTEGIGGLPRLRRDWLR